MLIKMPKESAAKFRLYQLTYTDEEIVSYFHGRYKCKECPFVLLWTGKVPEGIKDIHRMYCKLAHVSLTNLPAVFGSTIEQTWKFVEMLKNKSDIAPDTAKIHPQSKNKNRFILSCLRTKELDSCPLDLYNEGKRTLDEGVIQQVNEWRKKFLK